MNGVKAVAEQAANKVAAGRPVFNVYEEEVDEHGFTKVKKGNRAAPLGATVADFMTTKVRNKFEALNSEANRPVFSPVASRAKPAGPVPAGLTRSAPDFLVVSQP